MFQDSFMQIEAEELLQTSTLNLHFPICGVVNNQLLCIVYFMI